MTVRQLQRRLSVREFGEWVAFYRHEAKEEEKARKKARARRRR